MAEKCGFLLSFPLQLHHPPNQNWISYRLSYQSLANSARQAGKTHLLIFPLPSQTLFEALLWHCAYNNCTASRLLRQAHDQKHLVALSFFFIPSFPPCPPSTSMSRVWLYSTQHMSPGLGLQLWGATWYLVASITVHQEWTRIYPSDFQGGSPSPMHGSTAAAGKKSDGEEGRIGLCFHRKTRVEKGGETANQNKKPP